MKIFFYAFLKEWLGNFCLGIGIFSLFFFFAESSKIFELALLVAGSSLSVFLGSLGYLYAQYWMTVAGFICPMALLLGIALTMARLHEDNELIALESLGAAVHKHLLALLAVLGAVLSACLFPLIHHAGPLARLHLKRFAYEGRDIAKNFRVEPQTWIDLGRTQIFAEEVTGNRLNKVVIYSSRDQNASNAEQKFPYKVTGSSAVYRIQEDAEGKPGLFLRVFSGKLDYPDLTEPGNLTTCSFATYENTLPLLPPAQHELSPREMVSRELKKAAGDSLQHRLELESRHALAISPLALALACGLVTVKLRRRSKGFGFGLALAMLGAYWLLLVLATSVKEPWMANPAFLSLSWLLSLLLAP
ncbi:MAG: LptF/LptG family permease [Elusimicrobia bacterium]|nr:LptF/LptG family permease [Elusimicrobiota bacterium]